MARESTPQEFRSRLTSEAQRQFDLDLAQGKGHATYVDGSGTTRLLTTYGTRDADIVGLPPKAYGQSDWELGEYCPPVPGVANKRSPLLDYEPPQQISAPRRSPSQTAHPEVLISGRTSSHPRGDSEYIRRAHGSAGSRATAPGGADD